MFYCMEYESAERDWLCTAGSVMAGLSFLGCCFCRLHFSSKNTAEKTALQLKQIVCKRQTPLSRDFGSCFFYVIFTWILQSTDSAVDVKAAFDKFLISIHYMFPQPNTRIGT